MYLLGIFFRWLLEHIVGKAVEDKHIEPEQKDWDWGDEYQPKEFEASIAIEWERATCANLIGRINAFLSEGGTIPNDLVVRLADAIEADDRSPAAASDEFSCRVLYAQAPTHLRIEQTALGPEDSLEGSDTGCNFVVLKFFSSRELAERIEMEFSRYISERSKSRRP